MRQGAYMQTQRRRKRGKRILATVAFVLTVVSVATIICLVMFFGVEEISVVGVSKYTPEQIIELSRIQIGQNIFAIDTATAEQDIYDGCPYIDSVRVRRLLPTVVELAVTETTPVLAAVNSSSQYTLLGQNGRVLEQVEDVSTEGLPIVVGANLSELPEGRVIGQRELDTLTRSVAAKQSQLEDGQISQDALDADLAYLELLHQSLQKLSAANNLIAAAAKAGLQDISYYDVSDDLSVSLLYDHRIVLEFGSELELDYKMQFAVRVIDELADNFAGTIELSTAGSNQKVYTREQDIAPLMNQVYLDGYY